jgi:hypothetical protein
VKVCPPAVIVPVREAVAGFGATVNVIVPLPEPLAPAVIVIHAALLVAAQLQPVPAVIMTVPVPPEAVMD